MPTKSHRARRIAAGACVLLVATACSSQGSQDAHGEQSIGAAESQAQRYGQQGQGSTPVDACAQIPAAEIDSLLRKPLTGMPRVNGGESTCTWEDPVTNLSITLEIGASGSAPGGRLPDQDPMLTPKPIPGADGMLLVASDQVMFPAKDRLCSIQVVTDVSQRDKDHATGVRLAREVQGRI